MSYVFQIVGCGQELLIKTECRSTNEVGLNVEINRMLKRYKSDINGKTYRIFKYGAPDANGRRHDKLIETGVIGVHR